LGQRQRGLPVLQLQLQQAAHVAINNHDSRVRFVQMHPDEKKVSAVAFLQTTVAHCKALGVSIKRLIIDNGSAYRLQLLTRTCQALGIKHTSTGPYRPQANGKAERFIQTCLREWAYGCIWAHNNERTAWLPAFLAYYNIGRPHSALHYQLQRPGLPGTTYCNSTLHEPSRDTQPYVPRHVQ